MIRRSIIWILLSLVIVVSGYFHFHALEWHQYGNPHPDEGGVISQTYDMMVQNTYKPRLHTWGHFGYYTTIFSYKSYTLFQDFINGLGVDEESESFNDIIPNFQNLVYSGAIVPIGISGVFLFCFLYMLLAKISQYRIRSAVLLIVFIVIGYFIYGKIKVALLYNMHPNREDVLYMGRFLSAFFLMLSIPMLYDIGRRLYRPSIGLVAAVFFAFTVLGVQLAHFFAADTYQTFCIVFVIWTASAIITSKPNPTTNKRPEDADTRQDRLNGVNLGQAARYLLRVNHSVPWKVLLLYIMMGLGVGMAMSSKFSSAPIFLIPVVTHLLFTYKTKAARQFMVHFAFVLCCLMCVASWFYFQPYAWENEYTSYASALRSSSMLQKWLHILFSGEYARQIFEQSQMVKLTTGLPWTQQFVDTVPYMTMFMQMIRWSFGWPLGVVCVAGFFLIALRNFFKPRASDLLLLSWVGVELAIIGTFKSTFPRYTMACIPFVALLGAVFCLDNWTQGLKLPEKIGTFFRKYWKVLGYFMVAAGIVSGFLYCVAYMTIYDHVHTNTYASLWIYKNIPRRQPETGPTKIVHEGWDHSIPWTVFNHSANYGTVEMAPYHGDGESKVRTIAAQLAQADVVALPTTRLYGTTMKVQDKYRFTTQYYKALFAGQLGFTLQRTVTRPASLWGWEFNDIITADESHRVYDHPKNVIFVKTEPFTSAQYYDRIVDLSPEVDAITRKQMMSWKEPPREQILNIVRDPYPDDGVLSREEIQALLQRAARVNFTTEMKDSFLNSLNPVEAITVEDLTGELQQAAMSEVIDRETIDSLLEMVEQLPLYEAYAMDDIIAEVYDLDLPIGSKRQLEGFFRFYLENDYLSIDVVKRKLEDIDLAAAQLPQVVEQQSSPDAAAAADAPEKIALISQGKGGWFYGAWQLIKWLIVLDLLGMALLPLGCSMFRNMPDSGYPLARVLGLVVVTYLVWISVNFGLLYFTTGTCWLLLVLTSLLIWVLSPKEHLWKVFEGKMKVVIATEILFYATFAFYLIVRSYNPEIFWGEKTMDFSFYNAVIRGLTFPPYEPWFSGTLLNYYYYGFILIGTITKLAVVPTAYGYNLGIATISALTVLCAFSLGLNLTKRVRWGVLAGLFVGFIGNFDPTYLYAIGDESMNSINETFRTSNTFSGFLSAPFRLAGQFGEILIKSAKAIVSGDIFTKPFPYTTGRQMWDAFWDTSRAIGPGMINEYPAWSWLFADLHAHVIVMPVSLLILSFSYLAFSSRKKLFDNHTLLAVLFLAIAMGLQFACNIWDFLSYTGLIGFVIFLRAFIEPKDISFLSQVFPALDCADEQAPKTCTSYRERIRPPFYLSLLGMALFVILWTIFWPQIIELHPYWLGVFNFHWFGFLIAFIVVLVSLLKLLTLFFTEASFDSLWILARKAMVPFAIILALSWILFYHFHVNLHTESATIKANNDGNINFWEAMRHFGFFYILSLAWVFMSYLHAFLKRYKNKFYHIPSPIPSLVLTIILELVVFNVLKSQGYWYYAGGLSLYAMMLPLQLGLMLLWRRDREKLFVSTLLFLGWGIAATSEMIVIIDRMNTVFKLYHHTWMFVAIGTAAAIGVIRTEWMGTIFSKPKGSGKDKIKALLMRLLRFIAVALFLYLFLLTLICTYRGVAGTMGLDRQKSDVPTIDGLNFLKQEENFRRQEESGPELFAAINWLNKNVAGPQVIAEAFTNRGYDESTIVCKYTGLPTILGWPHHTKQRGHTPPELSAREQDLRALYTTDDDEKAQNIIEKYDIGYIFAGHIEKVVYQNPLPVLEERGNLQEVFRSETDKYVIFETNIAQRQNE